MQQGFCLKEENNERTDTKQMASATDVLLKHDWVCLLPGLHIYSLIAGKRMAISLLS